MKLRKVMLATVLVNAIVISSSSCTQAAVDAMLFLDEGLHPPQIISVEMISPRRIEIHSDSELARASLRIDPEIDILESGIDGETAWFILANDALSGTRYRLLTVLENKRRHSTQAVRIVNGFNPEPVTMLFNEIIVRGSGNNPDCIEFYVIEGGNLGGTSWYLGTPENYDALYHFPGIQVDSGEYIVLHVRPEGIPEEIDELESDLSLSGGRQSHPEARDLWLQEETGLPSNNAVITLFNSKDRPMDVVIYSNRTSDSDQLYRGFGTSKMQTWADTIAGYNIWAIEGSVIKPEDAVSPEGSTGTRSLNRSWTVQAGEGGQTQWYIVPTRGATMGYKNSSERYEP